MTVKKALECYRGQKLFVFNGKKPEIYIHDIIDLINRYEEENRHLDQESDILRADVENLNRINDELNAENESLKAEVERLNNNISAMSTTLSTSARATRHEAYKEFAERLNKEFSQCQREYRNVLNSDGACAMIIAKKVTNNLLNELVGDLNGKRKD